MQQLLSSIIKLFITLYLLFGAYTLFVGFLEKNRKKKIIGALILILPTAAIIALVILLANLYGSGTPQA